MPLNKQIVLLIYLSRFLSPLGQRALTIFAYSMRVTLSHSPVRERCRVSVCGINERVNARVNLLSEMDTDW